MHADVITKIKTAPKDPGVYIFYGNNVSPRLARLRRTSSGNKSSPLYIGKAANLRARLKSYLKVTDIKTRSLNEEAARLEYLTLRSDIEALIEESRLIKELKPKYNVVFRDDKSYSYVYFSKDDFPKIFIAHEKPRRAMESFARIGPFTDAGALRLVMKLLRRTFPYCTCLRQGSGKASLYSNSHLRDCLNAQIGKCLGFCCLKNRTHDAQLITDYRRMLRKIKMILKGQSPSFAKVSRGGKKLFTEQERAALESIFAHSPYLQLENEKRTISAADRIMARRPDEEEGVSKSYFISGEPLPIGFKVEGYDNSNFAGKEAVGAMTVLKKIENGNQKIEWAPDKSGYRKFIIKSAPTQDDPRMIGELISRRLNHPEWPYPDLIVIDGGLTQYRAAKTAAQKFKLENLNLKIISYAKPHKLVYGLRPSDIPTPLFELSKEFREMIDQVIYQTHNFVIRFHRDKRNKEFLPR